MLIRSNIGDSMSRTIEEFLEEQSKKDIEGRITLSKDAIIELQNRIKHYLNSYETENRMNAAEVARVLDYTPMHYSRFKNVGMFNKVASVFLFLSNLAKLKEMSLSEFIIYVENKPMKSANEQLSRSLHDWELELIDFMSKIESTIRRFFTRRAIHDAQENENVKNKLEIGMTLSTLIAYLDIGDLKLLISIIKDFSKRADLKVETQKNETLDQELIDMKRDIIKFMKEKLIHISESEKNKKNVFNM